jgi:hypothetical protein
MKIHNIIFCISVIAVLIISAVALYTSHISQTTWEAKEIHSRIKEFTLYNTFPNNALYVGFINGEYILCTENRYWAYTQLINLDISTTVDITYKENKNHDILITKINGWYYD